MKVRKRVTVCLARILAVAMMFSTFSAAPSTQARAAENDEIEIVPLADDAGATTSDAVDSTDLEGYVNDVASTEVGDSESEGPEDPENIVYSTSFEEDTEIGSIWTKYGSPTGFGASTDDFYVGSHSLAVSGRTAASQGALLELGNKIEVEAGQAYEASMRVKLLVDDKNVTSAQLKLQQKFQRTGDDAVDCRDIGSPVEITTDEWVELKGTFTGASSETARIYIRSANENDTASFYVDEVTVTKVDSSSSDEPNEPIEPEAPENAVYYTSFEEGLDGFKSRGGATTAEQSQETSHAGSYSLKVTGRTSNWHGAAMDITDLVEAGETYEASVWVRLLDTETANATLQLSAVVTIDGSESYKQFDGAAGTVPAGGGWVQLAGSLTMDESWSSILFYIEGVSSPNASFYMDDVAITLIPVKLPEEPDYTLPEPEYPELDPSLTTEEIMQLLQEAIVEAEAWMANSEFPIQVSTTGDGSDVNMGLPWMTKVEMEEFDTNLAAAYNVSVEQAADAYIALQYSINKIKANGSDPYFRFDPGDGQLPIDLTAPTNDWQYTTPLDSRVPSDYADGTVEVIDYPFADSEGKGQVLQINYAHNGESTFGGITVETLLDPAVEVPAGSNIEFDVYYPKSAQGKYMRWRIATTNRASTVDAYMRDYDYTNLNPDWIGSYMGETWLLTHHSFAAPTGTSSTFILELHGENSRPAETGTLIIANIKITTPDPEGTPLPDVYNKYDQSEVEPLKSLYNRDNGLFMVGAIGTGTVTSTRARHYELFVNGNNLKPDSTHPRAPEWLVDIEGNSLGGTVSGLAEYSFPTENYQAVRDSGEEGEYKLHGHVMAWYNQAPSWMTQIIPEHLENGYDGDVEFYGLGNNVTTTTKVDKETAKRVQFNQTMYVMRHFMTTDEKYGSSEERGIIPFNSWDILNEEIHESRHSELIPGDPTSWRESLKHTNWLVAMSDDDISGDITDHYIYLLFKYAHIAIPNEQMAAAYKANYDSLPEYMKMDGHDNNGSIDEYVVANPPKLTYNDYGTNTRSKARTIYNMVLELNTAWLSDPLYDGRPLIEDIGFQGHDSVGPTLASDSQYAMALFASLIDEGLLCGISFSEFDLKLLTTAPGGSATAPDTLNVKQSDALGYQYALMYKLFTKFAPYVDHIISWGVAGEGWQGSYVLFDQFNKAASGYYAAMDPDRFISGHAYLDNYFAGELEKLAEDYVIDLGDLGTYVPDKDPSVPKHVHSWATAWSSNASGHWHECTATDCTVTVNSEKDGYAAHTSDRGVVTKAATSTSNGEITYSCTVCGYVIRTETIPATGSSGSYYPGGSSSSSSSGTATVTVSSTSNGSVSISSRNPNTGDTVTITPRPNSGYEVGTVTVKDSSGNKIAVTSNGNGTFSFVKPSSRVTVDVTFVKESETPAKPSIETEPSPEATTPISFVDVPAGQWYTDAVNWAVANGITNGTGNNQFSPDAACTRAQIVTFLWQAYGRPKPSNANNPFVDVDESAYYYEAVLWAVENGITNGNSPETFVPDDSCTRAQAVTFLYRAAGSPATSGTNAFTDVPSDTWYTNAVVWAVANGIANGMNSSVTFVPNSTCTRAHIVTFLWRNLAG